MTKEEAANFFMYRRFNERTLLGIRKRLPTAGEREKQETHAREAAKLVGSGNSDARLYLPFTRVTTYGTRHFLIYEDGGIEETLPNGWRMFNPGSDDHAEVKALIAEYQALQALLSERN